QPPRVPVVGAPRHRSLADRLRVVRDPGTRRDTRHPRRQGSFRNPAGPAQADRVTTDAGTPRRTRMSGAERREQLIGVARELFAERGYDATPVEDVAERAGVTKPVVYEHFGSKEALYATIADREVRALVDRITQALSPGHPHKTIARAVDAFLL